MSTGKSNAKQATACGIGSMIAVLCCRGRKNTSKTIILRVLRRSLKMLDWRRNSSCDRGEAERTKKKTKRGQMN